MHGSSFYIDDVDNGFMICATSGVGKSTHSRLLKEYLKERFVYINDDKPFIKKEDTHFYIYGSPYNGKENLSNNVKSKLKTIFILKRSKENKCNMVA